MWIDLPALSGLGGLAAFGACGLALALFGMGAPFLLAALIAALCAALALYAAGRVLAARRAAAAASGDERVVQLEHISADLRHELRGVLSPALMVTDRLLGHEDPAIRRAGQAVARSIERATELIVRNKQVTKPDP